METDEEREVKLYDIRKRGPKKEKKEKFLSSGGLGFGFLEGGKSENVLKGGNDEVDVFPSSTLPNLGSSIS